MKKKLMNIAIIITNSIIGYKSFVFYLIGFTFLFCPESSNDYEGIEDLFFFIPMGLTFFIITTLAICGLNYCIYSVLGDKYKLSLKRYILFSGFGVFIGNLIAFIVRITR